MATNIALKEAIERWKLLKVTNVEFEFSCGGDSMNDTDIIINAGDETISDEILENYFDNETYNKVDFSVNSDGHYQGEAGTVYIKLDGDCFTYEKNAKSEWSESFTEMVYVTLNEDEISFVKENILNFNGEEDVISTLYKKDIFLSDEDEALVGRIEEKIRKAVHDFVPKGFGGEDDGEISDWFSFNTTENNLSFDNENRLVVEYNGSETVFKDDDN